MEGKSFDDCGFFVTNFLNCVLFSPNLGIWMCHSSHSVTFVYHSFSSDIEYYMHSFSFRSSRVAVFLSSRPTREYRGAFMCLQNCMNIKDGVESLQILNTAAFLGDLDILRSVLFLPFCSKYLEWRTNQSL